MTQKPIDKDFISGLEDVRTVGRYKIIKKLGEGGSGVVYLGEDPYIKRNVAIKISNPKTQRSRERFFVEAQSAGRLNHPNIVSIYDVGVFKDYCYITMEYMQESLRERMQLDPQSKIKPQPALHIIEEILKALDYAHFRGVYHRDIKPENIMFRQDSIFLNCPVGTGHMVGMGEYGFKARDYLFLFHGFQCYECHFLSFMVLWDTKCRVIKY